MRSSGKPEWLLSTSIIILALPILYALSLGPALWLNERKVLHYDVLVSGWRPLVHGYRYVPECVHRYGDLWITRQLRDNLKLEQLARKDAEEQTALHTIRRYAGSEPD